MEIWDGLGAETAKYIVRMYMYAHIKQYSGVNGGGGTKLKLRRTIPGKFKLVMLTQELHVHIGNCIRISPVFTLASLAQCRFT